MKKGMRFKLLILVVLAVAAAGVWWLGANNLEHVKMVATRLESPAPAVAYRTIGEIPPPKGFTRTQEGGASFGTFLRQLALKQGEAKVYLFNGQEKGNQSAHWAVVDITTGTKNLQQCADVTMRLWAEYLYKHQRYSEIKFNFVSDGKPRHYTDFVKGNHGYPKFQEYMEWIFTYANTASLYRELKTVNADDLSIGDVFIQTGNPVGHAVIVVDMAQNTATGEKVFLLAQGYMPAQDVHVLKNPNDGTLSPWYGTNYGSDLVTPEFIFSTESNYKIKRYGK